MANSATLIGLGVSFIAAFLLGMATGNYRDHPETPNSAVSCEDGGMVVRNFSARGDDGAGELPNVVFRGCTSAFDWRDPLHKRALITFNDEASPETSK